MKNSLHKFKLWLLKVLQLQLFISIISLPILIMWGLPISLASPLGNLLFTPVLSLFLLLSSLIFFFELVCIPNKLLIYLLDLLSNLWMKFFYLGTSKWLITFPLVSNIALILIPLFSLGVLQHKRTNSLRNSIIAFTIILVTSCAFFRFSNTVKNGIETTTVDNKRVTTVYNNNKLSVIDMGEISKSFSPHVFMEYSLIPYLIKKFGHSDLDTFVIKFNTRTMNTIEILINKIHIKKIYFILNHSKFSQKTYFPIQLISHAKSKNIEVKFINTCDLEKIAKDIYTNKL